MAVVVAVQGTVRDVPPGVSRWIYAGDDAAWRRAAGESALAALPEIDTGERRTAAADTLRRPYLDAIGALSVRNASPAWWATHLAAKQPYPSLFSRLCALRAALDVLVDGALVVCGTPAIARQIAAAASARGLEVHQPAGRNVRRRAGDLGFQAAWPLLRALGDHAPEALRSASARLGEPARFALDRTPGHRRRTLEGLQAGRGPADFAGPDTALLVTWLDDRSFSGGGYRDPHLGPLAEQLRARGLRTALLARVLPTADFRQAATRLAASGEEAFVPDAWLTGADWREAERRAAHYAPDIPAELAVGDLPFAGLAREYLDEHRRAQADALTYDTLVARLDAAGVRPGRVVIPWEGHAWEAALIDAVHRRWPGTPVFGADNVNFTRLALSLYPAAAELGLRPLPDHVVTNGPAFARVLAAEGFPAERVRVGCALRHGDLVASARATVRAGDDRFRVLVAGSIDAAQTAELVTTAASAFGGDATVDARVKLHPACDRGAVPELLPFDDTPIDQALRDADVLLYTYSVVVYEALAAGVPPVFVRSAVLLDLDQLEPFPDLGDRVRGADELRAAVGALRRRTPQEHDAWAARAREAVVQALAPCAPGGAADPFL